MPQPSPKSQSSPGPLPAGRSCDVQQRAEALADRVFLGGPPAFFADVGREQLAVLLVHGLHPTSNVLDVGCGCLRGGYWIMRVLDPGHYFGIEPNVEMVQIGLEHIVEPQVLRQARPRFDHNTSFDFGVFGVTFDFVVARSVWTHASRTQIATMMAEFGRVAASDAVMLASYIPSAYRFPPRHLPRLPALVPQLAARLPTEPGYTDEGWVGRSHASEEGGVVTHSYRWLVDQGRRLGLDVRQISHPTVGHQQWLRVTRR